MADATEALPAGLRPDHGADAGGPRRGDSWVDISHAPRALREALGTAHGGSPSTPPDSTSEEDYDDYAKKPLLRRRKARGQEQVDGRTRSASNLNIATMVSDATTPSDASSEAGNLNDAAALKAATLYTIAADDKELRAILRRGLQRVSESCARVPARATS